MIYSSQKISPRLRDFATSRFIATAREVFKKVKEPIRGGQGLAKEISIADCLTGALAIFKLKYPSLLQFEQAKVKKHIAQNLKNLFGLRRVPCDTYMRERLDNIDLKDLRKVFTSIFADVQRGKYIVVEEPRLPI